MKLRSAILSAYSSERGAQTRVAEAHGVSRQYVHKLWQSEGLEVSPRTTEEQIVAKLLKSAKSRARARDREFKITAGDVSIPSVCPVLGIPLFPNKIKRGDNSPSIDRIKNSRGYVPGNVVVVSYRANRIKSDATAEELRKLAEFYS